MHKKLLMIILFLFICGEIQATKLGKLAANTTINSFSDEPSRERRMAALGLIMPVELSQSSHVSSPVDDSFTSCLLKRARKNKEDKARAEQELKEYKAKVAQAIKELRKLAGQKAISPHEGPSHSPDVYEVLSHHLIDLTDWSEQIASSDEGSSGSISPVAQVTVSCENDKRSACQTYRDLYYDSPCGCSRLSNEVIPYGSLPKDFGSTTYFWNGV